MADGPRPQQSTGLIQRKAVSRRFLKVVAPGIGKPTDDFFVEFLAGGDLVQFIEVADAPGASNPLSRERQHSFRPFLVTLAEHRKVDQPLTRIVHQLELNTTAFLDPALGPAIQIQDQARNALRRFRPSRISADEAVTYFPEWKLWKIGMDVVAYLRTAKPAVLERRERRQRSLPPSLGPGIRRQKRLSQCSDKHRFSRAGEAGDAESDLFCGQPFELLLNGV